jgi:hypothetical protein
VDLLAFEVGGDLLGEFTVALVEFLGADEDFDVV